VPKIILPGQNVAIQTPYNQIEPLWYEKLKGWESWINLVSAIFPSGPATPTTPATALHVSLGADVLLNNTANYFDGPSIAQGSSGTWWVSGNVLIGDTVSATLLVKLWDGTTIIDSGAFNSTGSGVTTISLSGFITSPVGNLKISVKDNTSVNGRIYFNASGNSRDSTISAFRIA
jgi:hypothetical protein